VAYKSMLELSFVATRELARRLDRDAGAVKRDLDVLFECDVIEYDEKGARKAPRLKHDNVFVEPLFVR